MLHELQIIERSQLDTNRWNELVKSSNASVYNQLHYLDTLSENWCALVWGDYAGAMAIPYTVRLGVKGVFTPNFIRSLDWMGEKPDDFRDVERLLRKQFKRANFNTNEALFSDSSERVYQYFETEEALQLGSQSKRSIKKFEKTGLQVEQINVSEALPLVISELQAKVKELKAVDFQRFEKLLLEYDTNQCHCYGIKGETLHAAIILIEWNNELLHIKSGVDTFGKQHGFMHALMNDVIQKTFEQGKKFSFEGSFVDSVRQFNLGFGAKDKTYFSWIWDASPWWFNLIQKIK